MTELKINIKDLKILIIDEDNNHMDNIINILSYKKIHNIEKIYHKEKALAKIKKSIENKIKYNIIILDMMLPSSEAEYKEILNLEEEITQLNTQINKENDKDKKSIYREKINNILNHITEELTDKSNGFEILNEINENIKSKKMSQPELLIVLSAVGDSLENEVTNNYNGVIEVLSKPASIEMIYNLIVSNVNLE